MKRCKFALAVVFIAALGGIASGFLPWICTTGWFWISPDYWFWSDNAFEVKTWQGVAAIFLFVAVLLLGLPASAMGIGKRGLAAGFLIAALAQAAVIISFFVWTDGPHYVTLESSASMGSQLLWHRTWQEQVYYQPAIGSYVALAFSVVILISAFVIWTTREGKKTLDAIQPVIFD